MKILTFCSLRNTGITRTIQGFAKKGWQITDSSRDRVALFGVSGDDAHDPNGEDMYVYLYVIINTIKCKVPGGTRDVHFLDP